MTTKLRIVPPRVKKNFDMPPQFNITGREEYFQLESESLLYVEGLQSVTNKVCFVLQLGYFRFAGKFFKPNSFFKKDITFVAKLLGVDKVSIDLPNYKERTSRQHQAKILELLKYKPFDEAENQLLKDKVEHLTKNQEQPHAIMMTCISNLRDRKVEIPTFHVFANFITNAFNDFEKSLNQIIEDKLPQEKRHILDELLPLNKEDGTSKESYYKRAKIVALKHINHTIRPGKIKQGLNNSSVIKTIRDEFQDIIEALNLSPESTKYFAVWVHKARSAQIRIIPFDQAILFCNC